MKLTNRINLKTEHIEALLKGMKLQFIQGNIETVIYPERYGYFVTPEELHSIQIHLDMKYGEKGLEIINKIKENNKYEI